MIQVIAISNKNERITDLTIESVDFDRFKWWWIDFNNPTEDEIKKLDSVLHFHQLAIEDCIFGQQRAKLDYYDDYSLIVTHTLGPTDFDQYELNFFIGPNYIVTFHLSDLNEVNQVWNNFLLIEDLSEWDEYRIFYELFDKIVDNFFPIIYELEDKINEVEQNPHDLSMDILLDYLFELRHQLLKLRHAIHPIRDLLYRILNSHHLVGIEERKEYFRDIYDHLLKLSEMIESNREITNDIRDNFISLNSYQQNKVIQILTVITSIFAPLTFIAGIYGMNFIHMPELKWQYGYFIILAVMAIITIFMIIWFKKKGWFD
ncbi:magnesium/cobalt transporter CorA [Ornithinibacillus bavariensis]|uniref:Magnesium transport protein CorA n=1 Tax=Ornithinibacillus bavariensis TaxID=545502 RepID=A0A919X8N1_9BACI|nr:magnesium/cobalt transporter CorA [Ornithinibacillus bavariensis]GIO27059.1 putative metal ion transporter YfjQ [Ornithinibacillus bavariensis]HAM80132.1 magnesium and cobalt transport protein CorA [Ornithinibacillus sp.]